MGARLTHVAFDIETTGFDATASVTVIGLALPLGCRVFLNTGGRSTDQAALEEALAAQIEPELQLSVHPNEAALLTATATFLDESVAARDYLLVAYNGDRFNGGFDLPFLRSRYALQELPWPFDGIPYADIYPLIKDRFNTTRDGTQHNDLVNAYDTLIGGELTDLDPFADSQAAVSAFETGAFEPLCSHNIADIRRTKALARLAAEFCGKSEFSLKSLTPSARDPAFAPRQ